MARLVPAGKRSLTAALLAAVLGATAVPISVEAAPTAVYAPYIQHVVHPNDGQGDSPLVP